MCAAMARGQANSSTLSQLLLMRSKLLSRSCLGFHQAEGGESPWFSLMLPSSNPAVMAWSKQGMFQTHRNWKPMTIQPQFEMKHEQTSKGMFWMDRGRSLALPLTLHTTISIRNLPPGATASVLSDPLNSL